MVNLYTEKDIVKLIAEDAWMMDVLKTVKVLDLPDWWICAGFIRSKIWDTLHGYEKRTELEDVDVIYFDSVNLNEQHEKAIERTLREMSPKVPWSVKNQARMHRINGLAPYHSSVEGISNFPETVTALGVKLATNERVVLKAPHGIKDVVLMEVKPTPTFMTHTELGNIYRKRVMSKKWGEKWPKVKVNM